MPLRIAIPHKGRLARDSFELLRRIGMTTAPPDGRLVAPAGRDGEVLFVRAQDIPRYVESGSVDVGITGLDLVEEQQARVRRLLDLDFGRCRLTLAVPRSARIRSPSRLPSGARIATPFPNLTRRYFRRLGRRVRILAVTGATEVTPYLGVCDAIADLVETGSTLREHNMVPLGVILESHAVLIGSTRRDRQVPWFVEAVESVLAASRRRYLMANVHRDDLDRVMRIMPALDSPTVTPLAKEGMYAVHSVVPEEGMNALLSRLRKSGARGILDLAVERLVP